MTSIIAKTIIPTSNCSYTRFAPPRETCLNTIIIPSTRISFNILRLIT